jgi:uncharacterized protein (TIGR02246 family)
MALIDDSEGNMGLLDDRDAIRDVMARFTLYIDTGRAEEWAALFTPDGKLTVGNGEPVTGRAALEKLAHDTPAGSTHHFFTDEVIDIDGDRAVCQYSLLVTRGQPPTIAMCGRNRDELVKVDGRWQVNSHVITPDT